MTTTPHLGFTLVEQSQAQKEVTVNTALTAIDAMLNSGITSMSLSTPPGSPATGAVYIVGASPTGAWAGQANNIAYYNQIWQFIVPQEGVVFWVNDQSLFYAWNGSSWVSSPNGEANTASNLGSGTGLYASKTGVNLAFKSLVAGSNVTITSSSTTVTIAASDGGGGGSPGGSSGQLQYDSAGAFGGMAGSTVAGSGTLLSIQAQMDTDIPLAVKAHSGTQSGDLLEAQSSTGSVLAKIDHAGNITGTNLSGSNSGDQTITLTGDMTGSGTGSFATTISGSAVTTSKINNSAVTYAKIQNETASTLLGNPTGSAAAPSEITLGATLAFSSSVLQTAAHTGDITTSANSFATTIATNAVSNAKFRQSAANALVGNPTGSTANVTDITLGSTLTFSSGALQTVAHTGDVTTSANSFATTIASGAVTNAKMANMANNTIKSNVSGSAGAPSDNSVSAILDAVLGATQGSIVYRGSAAWAELGPGTSGQFLQTQGASANPQWASPSGGGTVTSVGLTMPAEFSISGSPVTASGTLAVSKANQNANLVYAGPASGSAAAPTFRALSVADLPIADFVSYTMFGGV